MTPSLIVPPLEAVRFELLLLHTILAIISAPKQVKKRMRNIKRSLGRFDSIVPTNLPKTLIDFVVGFEFEKRRFIQKRRDNLDYARSVMSNSRGVLCTIYQCIHRKR